MGQMDRVWFDDDSIKQISKSSKERITTFFEVENRGVTVGHILHQLNIDHRTIKRVIEVMVKNGLVEHIPTTNYTQYRRVQN